MIPALALALDIRAFWAFVLGSLGGTIVISRLLDDDNFLSQPTKPGKTPTAIRIMSSFESIEGVLCPTTRVLGIR